MPDGFEAIRRKIRAPAILLLVAGVFNGLLAILVIAAGFGVLKQASGEHFFNLYPQEGIIGVISLLISMLIYISALCMKNLKYFGLALTGSILALIPCCGGLCAPVSLPAGIWALIVLNNAEVKTAFR